MLKDPILTLNPSRFTSFPINYPEIWELYKKAESLFWTAEEIDLTGDTASWKKLNANEQHFIKYVLAFFAASDGIVNENLASKFYSEVGVHEARAFYAMQIMMETIHSETYSLLIDTYISDPEEKNKLFNAVETIPIISKKAKWAIKWINSDRSFAERLIGFIAVEGIFFSSSFCAIYWIKDKSIMDGLCFSNELISRDEGLHCDFGILLHKHLLLENQAQPDTIYEIIKEAVDIECEFAMDALPVSLIGMNTTQMQIYIKFIADRLLVQMGLNKIYNVANPFGFMERLSLQNKTNFHEKKVAEYRKSGVGNTGLNNEISFNEDF